MANFTPVSAAIGGALIGLAAVLLMLSTGRIAGVSGILGGLLAPSLPSPAKRVEDARKRADAGGLESGDKSWRVAFIAGLILAPLSAGLAGFAVPVPEMPASFIVIVAAGLLVGFGSRLGSGCTSGHGVCGIARLSPRSLAATGIFMVVAVVAVALTRHVLGG
jgi:uncharacterized membrane protein YedE/YeeE